MNAKQRKKKNRAFAYAKKFQFERERQTSLQVELNQLVNTMMHEKTAWLEEYIRRKLDVPMHEMTGSW